MLLNAEARTIEGYDALVLHSPDGRLEAAFVPRVGNVLAWLRHDDTAAFSIVERDVA
jgi:hypothetical protein